MPYSSESTNEPIVRYALSGNTISPALRRALIALETGDFYTRWEAAKLISGWGIEATRSGFPETVIEPLLSLLQSDDAEEEISWYVARILGTFNHPLALQGLTHLLQTSQSSDVKGMAATALANCGAAAIPPLTDSLRHPEMRLLAIRALAQIQHPDIVPILLTLTADSLPAVRATAIDALSRFPDPAIADVLFTALQDVDSSVRRSAVSAIGLRAQTLGMNPCPEPTDTAENLSSLIAALQPLLWDLDLEVCCQTALTLGRIGTPGAMAQLSKVLQSYSTPVVLQQAIIRAIGWSDTPQAVGYLQQSLLDPRFTDESLLEIITVLGRLRLTESSLAAIKTLLDLLDTQHPISQTSKGKQTIAHSLGQLASLFSSTAAANLEFAQEFAENKSNAIMTALIRLLNDPDAGVQLHVIAALKAFDDQLVNSKLTALMQDETTTVNLREGIAVALAERKRSIE